MIKSFFIRNKLRYVFVLMTLLLAVLIIPLQDQGHQVHNQAVLTTVNSIYSISSHSKELLPSTQDTNLLNYQAASPPTIELLSSSSTKSQTTTTLPEKAVYLTFDDGPSKLTGSVLDILKESKIQATFFVLGEQVQRYPEFITRAVEEGHVLGNHTFNHNYEELYKGFSPFWSQIKQTEEAIRLITGTRTSLVRAPGGTAGHFDDTYFTLLKQGGYQVIDWNVDSGDSKRRGVPAQEIIEGATKDIHSNQVVVLMHDGTGHEQTVKALPKIISYYKNKGYQFEVLTPELESVQFNVTKSARALNRQQPSSDWIAANVVPNAALFASGNRLVMDIGRMATDFKPGEFRISNGRIMVPLRATMEKIGIHVKWDPNKKLAVMNMKTNSLQINVATGEWTSSNKDSNLQHMTRSVQMNGDTLWVPLRDILKETGHDLISVSLNEEEWRIRTS